MLLIIKYKMLLITTQKAQYRYIIYEHPVCELNEELAWICNKKK